MTETAAALRDLAGLLVWYLADVLLLWLTLFVMALPFLAIRGQRKPTAPPLATGGVVHYASDLEGSITDAVRRHVRDGTFRVYGEN